jgi:hypothetical protein
MLPIMLISKTKRTINRIAPIMIADTEKEDKVLCMLFPISFIPEGNEEKSESDPP